MNKKIKILIIATLIVGSVYGQGWRYFDDSKVPFDTIRCYADTGYSNSKSVKRISVWAVVKQNPYRQSIDPGFSNRLEDYGYNRYEVLFDDRKTKCTSCFWILKENR